MLIIEQGDEYGLIRIFELNHYRFLEFGSNVEQSCVYLPDPNYLEYDYTRAMLMGALAHQSPSTALFLGLGAGTLTNACLQLLPLTHAHAIELRPHVVHLAKEYLFLTRDPKLSIEIGDAVTLLDAQSCYDLIFLDLYTDLGPSEAHATWDFLGQCKDKLNPNGWLIINQWANADGIPLEESLLKVRFKRHYWQCLVDTGNVILFIPSSKAQSLDTGFLKQQICQIEPSLGYSLTDLYKQIKYVH